MRAICLLITILLSLNSVHAEDVQCGSQRSIRKIIGPEPITSKLRAEAKKIDDLFFENGKFDQEEFSYIGIVKISSGKSWHIVLLETIWGCSDRSTPRLLVFSENIHYVGKFSHLNGRQPRVDGTAIVFNDIAPDAGNRIPFTEEGPQFRVLIDNDILVFNK